eukprot:6974504-Prymnesium_polylepis.1
MAEAPATAEARSEARESCCSSEAHESRGPPSRGDATRCGNATAACEWTRGQAAAAPWASL